MSEQGARERGLVPPLLDTKLESGFRVTTVAAFNRWVTVVAQPSKVKPKRRCPVGQRTAATEDEARANHAALCGEFGP